MSLTATALYLATVLALSTVRHVAALNFVALGDWGGIPVFPYVTFAESDVAKSMGEAATAMNSSFTVALGDNFYFTGVSSVHDSRFQTTYEKVFTADSLMSRWYVLAGNHDHYGNVTAQIDYTHLSKRWHFPSLYYTEVIPMADNSTLQLVMIDTVSLAGITDMFHRDVPLQPHAEQAEIDAQLAWLEETLAASKATWLLVCGHYPVWSVGEHGPTGFLVNTVNPLLEKYGVSAYLNGHDHSLQHIRPANQTVDYFTIGAGHLTDDSTSHEGAVPQGSVLFHYAPRDLLADKGGFASFQISAQQMLVTYYDDKGKEVYHYVNKSPRTAH